MRLILLLAIALPAITLAGCVTPEEDVAASATVTDVVLPEPALVYSDSAGNMLDGLPGVNGTLATVLSHIPTFRSAEPTIAVASNGYLFFQAMEHTMRSRDGGMTWEEISPLANTPTTLDPFLYLDPVTDRLFADQLYLGCSYLSYSDDYGDTWITNPAACGIPVNDHQKITSGAPVAPGAGVLYPSVMYYGYNALVLGSRVSVSLDGGLTWPVNAESVPPGTTCNGGLHGTLRTGPDGSVYLPKRDCDGPTVAFSSDNGMSWTQRKVGNDVGTTNDTKNPAVAVDSAGNVYMVWAAADNALWLSTSTDKGDTWSASKRVSPPAMRTVTMPEIIAGDPGRIVFAYYGTTNSNGGSPVEVDDNTTWGLYMSMSVDALDENPAVATIRTTPEDDPIQVGTIWMYGGGNPARNLLDFIGLAVDAEGRAFVAFADGCVDKCVTDQKPDNSRTAMGVVAIQKEGPSIYADVGILGAYTNENGGHHGARTLAAMARVDAFHADPLRV